MATDALRAVPRCHPALLGSVVVAVALAGALAPMPSLADSMRCGSRVVKEGDSIEKVLEVCGEPAEQERTWIQCQPRFEVGGQEYSFPGTAEVPVDVRTYDFGSHKLMQKVRFVDGKVDSIVPLGKGKSGTFTY